LTEHSEGVVYLGAINRLLNRLAPIAQLDLVRQVGEQRNPAKKTIKTCNNLGIHTPVFTTIDRCRVHVSFAKDGVVNNRQLKQAACPWPLGTRLRSRDLWPVDRQPLPHQAERTAWCSISGGV
jgi:hypothetical protein